MSFLIVNKFIITPSHEIMQNRHGHKNMKQMVGLKNDKNQLQCIMTIDQKDDEYCRNEKKLSLQDSTENFNITQQATITTPQQHTKRRV